MFGCQRRLRVATQLLAIAQPAATGTLSPVVKGRLPSMCLYLEPLHHERVFRIQQPSWSCLFSPDCSVARLDSADGWMVRNHHTIQLVTRQLQTSIL